MVRNYLRLVKRMAPRWISIMAMPGGNYWGEWKPGKGGTKEPVVSSIYFDGLAPEYACTSDHSGRSVSARLRLIAPLDLHQARSRCRRASARGRTNPMKIIVTGGSGFLGSHIADALSAAGHEAVIFDLARSRWLRSDQQMVIGNVLDRDAVDQRVARLRRRLSFGSHGRYRRSHRTAARRRRGQCHGNRQRDRGRAHPWSAALRIGKLDLRLLQSRLVLSHDQTGLRKPPSRLSRAVRLGFHGLRFGSLYGPRADRNNGVFQLLSQALTQRRIDHYGTGEEVREYIHVLDAAAMSVDVLAPEFANQFIHLTGRERMTSRDMLKMISEIFGRRYRAEFPGDQPYRPLRSDAV